MGTPSGFLAALVLVSMATPPHLAAGLPYEVQDTIVDLMSEKGFTGLQRADLKGISRDRVPRAIYRKDIGPRYIAYYEILSGDGSEYFLLSAGSKTGDNRFVESGDINATAKQYRPTDALNRQARLVGEACVLHYRLSEAGLYMCENRQGIPVAATYNWTSDAPIDPKEIKTSLPGMVKLALPEFNKQLHELRKEVGEEYDYANLQPVQSQRTEQRGEEALAPGSTHRIALGFNSKKSVKLIFTGAGESKSDLSNADWQRRLCSILPNTCTGRDLTSVSTASFAVAPNGLHYFQLTVDKDASRVQKALNNTDVSFSIQLTTDDGTLIEKTYGIETNFTSRTRRWSPWSYWSVYNQHLFPNYNQHRCCGCYSGCGAVAWAQVFAYYDRLAHVSSWYGFSQHLYRCIWGLWGSPACISPWWTPTRYVENIRHQIDTFCLFGGGATTHWDMTDAKLWNWYRSRQSWKAVLRSHTSWWSTLPGIYRSWIRDRAINTIQRRYPAIVGIWSGWSQHYAVATRYRSRYKRWRICWWFFGWHCTRWFYIYHREWYLHMGWGGSGNAWRKAKAFSAFSAER